mgnify:FL=1
MAVEAIGQNRKEQRHYSRLLGSTRADLTSLRSHEAH